MAGRMILVLAALCALPALASVQDVEARREEAFATLVADLEAYVAWCDEGRLYGRRAEAWETILTIDPDHAEAHRGLGHKKNSKGEWVVPKRSRRDAKDYDEEALREASSKRAEAVRGFAEQMTVLLEDPELPDDVRASLQAEVLAYDPENALVREARNEVRSGSGWVMRETETAIRRREELAAAVFAGFSEGLAIEAVEPNEKEAAFGLPFSVVETGGLRVLATGGPELAEDMARSLLAAQRLFDQAFGVQSRWPYRGTIYLLSDPSEKAAFLAGHPNVTDDLRAGLERLEGSGIEGTGDWAFWAGDAAKQRDGIVGMALGWFLIDTFRVDLRHGWAYEGFRLYFTKAVLGTRLNWFVNTESDVDPREAFAARGRLLDMRTNWMQEAHDLFAGNPPVDLGEALKRPAGQLGVADILCAHALAAYLVEGRPDEAAEILRGLARGSTEQTLKQNLGLGTEALQLRIARWIEESRAAEAEAPVDAARLHATWAKLDGPVRAAVVTAFQEELAELKTDQLRLVRGIAKGLGDAPAGWEAAEDPPNYDEKEHAPGQPIKRYRLDEDDPLVLDVHRQFFGASNPRELVACYRYEWATGEIIRTGDPEDVETVFTNAANGYPPGLDLVRAVVLRDLDRGEERLVLEAFAHAYTDREGGVYPGTTLYDAWGSGITIEMPDVDVLGIMHDVLDEWSRWVAPIPGSEHNRLYAIIQELYERARNYRTPREVLADVYAVGEPVDRQRFGPTLTNMHALWAAEKDRVKELAAALPDSSGWKPFLSVVIDRGKADAQYWGAGVDRQVRLAADGEEVRRALERAMQEVGALAEASSPGSR